MPWNVVSSVWFDYHVRWKLFILGKFLRLEALNEWIYEMTLRSAWKSNWSRKTWREFIPHRRVFWRDCRRKDAVKERQFWSAYRALGCRKMWAQHRLAERLSLV